MIYRMIDAMKQLINRIYFVIFGREYYTLKMENPRFTVEKSEIIHQISNDDDRETTYFLHNFDGGEEDL